MCAASVNAILAEALRCDIAAENNAAATATAPHPMQNGQARSLKHVLVPAARGVTGRDLPIFG